jgi:hypothetical protein
MPVSLCEPGEERTPDDGSLTPRRHFAHNLAVWPIWEKAEAAATARRLILWPSAMRILLVLLGILLVVAASLAGCGPLYLAVMSAEPPHPHKWWPSDGTSDTPLHVEAGPLLAASHTVWVQGPAEASCSITVHHADGSLVDSTRGHGLCTVTANAGA